MRRLLKWLLIIVVLLLVAGGGALWFASRNLDSVLAYFQKTIEEQAGAALGTKLSFERLSAKSFPSTTIELTHVRVDAGEKTPKIEAESVEAELELFALLAKRVAIQRLRVKGLLIDLTVPRPPTRTAGAPASAASVDGGKPPLQISRLDLADGRLLLPPGSSVKSVTIKTASTAVDASSTSSELVKLSGLVADFALDSHSFRVVAPALIVRQARKEFVLDNATMQAFGGSLDISGSYFAEDGDFAVQFNSEAIDIPQFSKAANLTAAAPISKGKVRAKGTIGSTAGKLAAKGTMSLSDTELRAVSMPITVASGKLDFNLAGDSIRFIPSEFLLRSDVLSSEAKLSGEGEYSLARRALTALSLAADFPRLDLAKAAALVPTTALREMKPSGVARLNVKIGLSPKGALTVTTLGALSGAAFSYKNETIREIQGKFSASYDAGGTGKIISEGLEMLTALSSEPLHVRLDLSLPSYSGSVKLRGGSLMLSKLGRLFPSSAYSLSSGTASADVTLELRGGSLSAASGSAEVEKAEGVIAAMPLRAMNASLRIAQEGSRTVLRVQELRGMLRNLKVSGRANVLFGEAIAFQGIDLVLGESQLRGEGRFIPGTPASGSARVKLEGGTLDALAQAFANLDEGALQGSIRSVQADITASDFSRLLPTLSGQIDFSATDARFKGVNIGRTVLEKVAALPIIGERSLEEIPPDLRLSMQRQDTEFKRLSGRVEASSGNFEFTNIEILSDLFNGAGNGSISLSSELKIRLLAALSPQISEVITRKVHESRLLLNRRGELEVPVSISGTLSAPRVLPDTRALLEKSAAGAAENAIKNLIQRGLDREQRRRAP